MNSWPGRPATSQPGTLQPAPGSRPSRGRYALRTLASLVVGASAAGLVGGPAFGYFAALVGSGTGTAATGTLQPLVIEPATLGSPSTSLTPGTTADLLLNLTNPNAVTVTIVSVAQAGGVTVVGGSGCTSDTDWPGMLGNSGVSVPTAAGLSITIAGGATDRVHLPSGATLATTSAAGCQGASFQIPVTVTVQQ